MKYIKLIRVYCLKDEKIAECIDVPLNKICVASLYGMMDDDLKLHKADVRFSVDSFGVKTVIDPGVIYQLIPSGKGANGTVQDNGFRFILDSVSNEKVPISDLNAKSFAELILKMELRGLVYSTDDAMPDIPEALVRLDACKAEIEHRDSQLESLRAEIAEKNKALDRQAAEISKLNEKLQEGQGRVSGKKASWWKRMFEKTFGSEDDPSWEG